MAVVSPADREGPITLQLARRLYGKPVSFRGRSVGRVFDVIGQVKEPYVVVRLSKGSVGQANLINKILEAK